MDKYNMVIHFLRDNIPFNNEMKPLIVDVVKYANNNFDYNLVLASSIFYCLNRINMDLLNMYNIMTNSDIKNNEFKDYYIKSKIPFKSEEGLFKLFIICKYYDTGLAGFSFDDILDTLKIIFKKTYFDTSTIDKLKSLLNDENKGYNIVNKQSGVDYCREQEKKTKDIIISDNQDKDGEINIVGYVGERDYYRSIINKKNTLSVWISKDIDKYAHLDHIEYDLSTNITTKTEVKSTTIDYTMGDIIISSYEKDELIKTLNRDKEIYVVRKKLYDKTLQTELGENIITFNDYDNFDLEGISKKRWDLIIKNPNGEYKGFVGGLTLSGNNLKTIDTEYQNIKSLIYKN